MKHVLAQFRRLYDDKGADDHDFSDQEENLRLAQARLNDATDELVRASERLNASALSSFATKH